MEFHSNIFNMKSSKNFQFMLIMLDFTEFEFFV
jgi:hypothetical protein